MAVLDVLNGDSELFRIYVTWGSILLIKTLLMSLLTVFYRRKHNVSNLLRQHCLRLFELMFLLGDE